MVVIFDTKIWFNLYLVVLESLIDCGFIVEMKRTTWYDNLRSKQIFIQNENMKQLTNKTDYGGKA